MISRKGNRRPRDTSTLSSAMDQSPAAVLIADKEGVIQYVNESFSKLTGYVLQELVNETPRVLGSTTRRPSSMDVCGGPLAKDENGGVKSKIVVRTEASIGRRRRSSPCATQAARSRIILRFRKISRRKNTIERRLSKARRVSATLRR